MRDLSNYAGHSTLAGSEPLDTRWTPAAKHRRSPRWEALQHIDIRKKTGAGEGIRTLDPNLGKVVLYP